MVVYHWLRSRWERAAAVGCAVAGSLAALIGWWGVSGVALPAQQISYLASGGILAVLLLGGAATLWLSADLRDQWRKLDDIYATACSMKEQLERQPVPEEPTPQRRRPLAVDDGTSNSIPYPARSS